MVFYSNYGIKFAVIVLKAVNSVHYVSSFRREIFIEKTTALSWVSGMGRAFAEYRKTSPVSRIRLRPVHYSWSAQWCHEQ